MIPWEVATLAKTIAAIFGEPDDWEGFIDGAYQIFNALREQGVNLIRDTPTHD